MRVVQIIVVGISALSTSFAQQHRYRSNRMCSAADQIKCCEMMLDRLEGARNFCSEHGCNQNICSGKPSGSGYDDDDTWRGEVKKDDKDEDNEHDHDKYVDLWESGGATQWGKDEDVYDAWGVDKWNKDKVGSDRAASAVLPSRQRQQRHLAWSPPVPVWGAPKYTEPKTYYPPPTYYYYPPPPAPKYVETCCTSGEKFCPMEFPMEKQVLLSGKVRVCCFTSRVDGGGGGGGGYYPYSYGGGGYQTRTPRYGGGGYGNRKLQYGGGDMYGPAQCPPPQNTPMPTRLPTTPAPTPAPTAAPTQFPTGKPTTLKPKPPPTPAPTAVPTEPPLVWSGNNGCPRWSPCGVCNGDCDNNNGCMPGLVCFKRTGSERVPGCSTGGIGDVPGADYCYDPSAAMGGDAS